MDSKVHTYTDVKNAVHRMLESNNVVRGSSTEHSLSILDQKWASVYSKIQERKVIYLFLPEQLTFLQMLKFSLGFRERKNVTCKNIKFLLCFLAEEMRPIGVSVMF